MPDQASPVASSLRNFIAYDLHRYGVKTGPIGILQAWCQNCGFRILFLFRLTSASRLVPMTKYTVYPLLRCLYHWIAHRNGVFLPVGTDVGPGLYLAHPWGIVVSPRSKIGWNCNLGKNVTIGYKSRGPRQGYPSLGDRVYVGTGAVIIGGIAIGDDCAIGANAVVTRDLPERSVAAGVPARVIGQQGSHGIVNNTLPTNEVAS